MIITTTPTIEGKKVLGYSGVIAGEAILDTSVINNLFSEGCHLIAGSASSVDQELQTVRDLALEELKLNAVNLGANGVIGVSINYQFLDKKNEILIVSATGTAIVIN